MSAVWEKVARWTGEERMGELLLAHYGLRLEGAVPVGGVLKIDTNRGPFALKRAGEGGESHWRGVALPGTFAILTLCADVSSVLNHSSPKSSVAIQNV